MKEETIENQAEGMEVDINQPGTRIIVEETIPVVQMPKQSSFVQNQREPIHTSDKPE